MISLNANETCFPKKSVHIRWKTSPRNLTGAAASTIQNQNLQKILLVLMIAQMLSAH